MTQIPANALQLRSTLKSTGVLEVSLATVPVPTPGPDEVLIEVQASPINPSDLGLLLGPADLSKAEVKGAGADLTLTAPVSEAALRALAGRVDQSMPVGNEGAGLVVKAGDGPAAQALLGKTVAVFGGSMYSQYRLARAADCLVLPPGTTAADGASCFVNPLTALGMVGTMRREGHTALVHTAAASNLGQMLNKICLKDGIDLVNIVRSAEQADILTRIGAKHVVDSSKPSFMSDLIAALTTTGATLAFDAIGGGKLANMILTGMEAAANANAKTYSRYGSTVHKQVYIYGGLDMGPTELNRGYGMAWGVGGWLLTPFLQKIGPEGANELRARVVAELKTTFASHYVAEISLGDVLNPDVARKYNLRGTGAKYLVTPNKS
jgi:NADPH:quinone reductase-like Zn-dependent oxidoreductase